MRQVLFTPWRWAYIRGETSEPADEGCFFCAAAADSDDPEHLVVHHSRHHVVLLNRHPYTCGHLMVAPLVHLGEPADAPPEARAELWPLVLRVQAVLRRAYQPHGFNIGLNLGSAAGAGVPGHFHVHLVPRWHGDSSFMGTIGDVRLVPEDLAETRARLSHLFREKEESR